MHFNNISSPKEMLLQKLMRGTCHNTMKMVQYIPTKDIEEFRITNKDHTNPLPVHVINAINLWGESIWKLYYLLNPNNLT